MFWTTAAHAMSGTGAVGGDAAGGLGAFVPLILMFAVFYFLLIRPQQKRAKEHKAMLSALKPGDEVVTVGGLYGRIVKAAEDHLMVDLGNTTVKLSRSAVSAVASIASGTEKKNKKDDAAAKEEKSDDK